MIEWFALKSTSYIGMLSNTKYSKEHLEPLEPHAMQLKKNDGRLSYRNTITKEPPSKRHIQPCPTLAALFLLLKLPLLPILLTAPSPFAPVPPWSPSNGFLRRTS